MKRIDLNGSWKFRAIDSRTSLKKELQRVLDWMPAQVPGTVHTDLLACKVISDPYYRMNELEVQWIENLQWEYRREFEIDEIQLKERRLMLVAEGLDTYAEIIINGKSAARTENMFIGHRFDVRKYVKSGINTVVIRFDSPVIRSKQLEKKHGQLLVALEPHRAYVRKAQYSFSWDWGPKLTTSGIWRSIFLEASSNVIPKNPFVKTSKLLKNEATVDMSVEIEHYSSPVEVVVKIDGVNGSEEIVKRATSATLKFRMKIKNPSVWWPNGYGDQPIYRATFSIRQKDGTVSEVMTTFGIRTIALLQEKDKEGKSFIIVVNGEKIFCKGADWIPSDNFIPRIPDATYDRLLTMARDANMNMIRVWGGGIYEQDLFYELCDRLGLLVWQDFMFACGEYPETSWFKELVKVEAEFIVRRLRNHPSIAVWCGNNESEWLFCTENPGKTPDQMTGAVLFNKILPSAVSSLDATRPYWRSSPFGDGFPNDEKNGTHHQWHVWSFWKDYNEYTKVNARFVSEFGFQAPATMRTWEEVTLPEDRTPQHPVIEHHNKQVEGQERLFRFQAAHYTVGKNFNDFVYRGQLVQANALKTAVEHWRRRKFNTAGALYWQLNDCWPVSSWSVIDSGLRPKASYYYTKRFFAKQLVSIMVNGRHGEVWGTNDSLEKISGILQVERLSFTGDRKPLFEETVMLKPNASGQLFRFSLETLDESMKRETYIAARFLVDGYCITENRLFFAEPKHLKFPLPLISKEIIEKNNNIYQLRIQTDVFAKDVAVEIEGVDAELSDNYFDLDAGSLKIIRCIVPPSVKNINGKVKVTSLHND